MATQDAYFDELETRDPTEREARLLESLARQVAHAAEHAPHYTALLADVDPRAIEDYAAFAALPVTRKSDLKQHQSAAPPFGGLTAVAPGELARIRVGPYFCLAWPDLRSGRWSHRLLASRSRHVRGRLPPG